MDMRGNTIAVIGSFESGKTTFIKAVRDAANGTPGAAAVEETPTVGIAEYSVRLPDGQSLTFLDTPGFDGYQAGDGHAKETEEILQMLEEYLSAKGWLGIVSHVFVFLNANDMATTEFKGRARRTFERIFTNSKLVCISTRWDQIEDDDGLPVTAEEGIIKEEGLYSMGKTGGSLLEYIFDDREKNGGEVLRFRSGLPTEAYLSPEDIVRKLFTRPASEIALEEMLATMTKERDDIAAKYNILLQERSGSIASAGDAAPVPDETTRTPRTRRQQLLDAIDKFWAQVSSTVTELGDEAFDVVNGCRVNREELEAASNALKSARSRFEEGMEHAKAAVEEYSTLRMERDTIKEQEQSLTAELDGLRATAWRSVRAQRLGIMLKRVQDSLKDIEGWMTMTEEEYTKGCQEAEQAAAEMEKLGRTEQGKERELNERLSPESEWLVKEQETARDLQGHLSKRLDVMREGLKDSWEKTLRDNPIFVEGLGTFVVNPEMVAHPMEWAPVIESFYESQVALSLSQEKIKFHSTVLQQLKAREGIAEREWKKGLEDIFGQHEPGFIKSSLPQLNQAPGPQDPVHEDLPLSPPPPPLIGHNESVLSVVFSWDGTKIVSGSADMTVRVWDAVTGMVQTVMSERRGHTSRVLSVAISRDGSRVASGSADKTVRVWKLPTGEVERVLEGHTDYVRSVALSSDGTRVISGSDDKTIRVWDASTGEVKMILTGHGDYVRAIALSGDGSRIISGSDDKTARVWDSKTGTLQRVLEGHRHYIVAVASSNDGSQIVTGSLDNTVRVWTAQTHKVLEGHTNNVYAVAVSGDGSRIISGSVDKSVRLWDGSLGKVQSVLEGHAGTVNAVAISRDGRQVASGSDDKSIRVWDPRPPVSPSPRD